MRRFPRHGPELRALLAACHADPDDDTPRLVLADWLDEHADPRGELVRLQCRLHALPADDPAYHDLFGRHEAWRRRYGRRWGREFDHQVWESGPHDRGLPTVGGYDDPDRMLYPADAAAGRVGAAVADGWAGFCWLTVEDLDDDPEWPDTPAPIGLAFDTANVSADQIARLGSVPNLRGLSLAEAGVTAAVLPQVATLTRLEHLDLGDLRLTDAGLRTLAPLKSLRTLASAYYGRGWVTDAGVEVLAGFPDLRALRLSNTRLTARGFKTLGGLSKLEVLDVLGLTDKALTHLRGLTRLQELRLVGTDVSGRGLEHFPRLTRLNLTATPVGDGGLAHLAGLRRLRWLTLDNTEVTGPGLAHLSGLPWLEDLSLEDAPVGDEGVAHLERLPRLTTLWLSGTRVTRAGFERLRGQLKKTDVHL